MDDDDENVMNYPHGLNISFAGCGFLGMYHVGVASCLRAHAPYLLRNDFSGASAGAIAAIGLLCDIDLGKATAQVCAVARECRSYSIGPIHPQFDITNFVRNLLDEYLPKDAHIKATGRLHISLTDVIDRKNVVISNFETREDLIQLLICSSYIPGFSGFLLPTYKGNVFIDGGLSDNIPIYDENTITISPFAGECDICPKDDITSSLYSLLFANTSVHMSSVNLYRFCCICVPPRPVELLALCHQGFDDCMDYLERTFLLRHCQKHLYYKVKTVVQDIKASQARKYYKACEDYMNLLSLDAESSDDECDCDDSDDDWSAMSDIDTEAECRVAEMYDCADCIHLEKTAVLEHLPQSVLAALKAAAKAENSACSDNACNMTLFENICTKLGPNQLPYNLYFLFCSVLKNINACIENPSRLSWFLKNLKDVTQLMKSLFAYVQGRYSATWQHQLALTDLEGIEVFEEYGLPVFKKSRKKPFKFCKKKFKRIRARKRALDYHESVVKSYNLMVDTYETQSCYEDWVHVVAKMESMSICFYMMEYNACSSFLKSDYWSSRCSTSLCWDTFLEIKEEFEQEKKLIGTANRLFTKSVEDTILDIGENVSTSSDPFAALKEVYSYQDDCELCSMSNKFAELQEMSSLEYKALSSPTDSGPYISTPSNPNTHVPRFNTDSPMSCDRKVHVQYINISSI